MADVSVAKKQREPLIHVVKRDELPGWHAWLIRIATVFIGMILVGFLSMLVTEKGFFETYEIMFKGVFGKLFEG